MKLPCGPSLKHIRFFFVKILLLIQVGVLFAIPELLLLFYVAQQFGKFTTIAVVMGTSLLGLFLVTNSVSSLARRIERTSGRGHFPRRELGMFALLVITGYLLITPGLIGFVLGVVIYYTPIHIGMRKLLYRRCESLILTCYYYMRAES